MLHVAQIGFFLDPHRRLPRELLRDWYSLVDVADAASQAGVRVSVIQACAHADAFAEHAVDYYFVQPRHRSQGIASGREFRDLVAGLSVDVFHVHGLGFTSDVVALATNWPETPILLQDHADWPPRIWRRHAWRRAVALASGIAFCAREQADPFITAGLVPPAVKIYEIPESSSRFEPGDRNEARRITSLRGDPGALWVGRLEANKDPLTVLDSVSLAARTLPGLELSMCFGAAPLLGDVESRIRRDPALRARVQLLGSVPHRHVELLLRSADLFVLGSHREGSGYAVIEALACGCPPVVTDIPSFRSLTGGGAVGALWPCGDAGKSAEALLSAAATPRYESRAAVRAHFEAELSFRALGRKLAAAYEDLRLRVGASRVGRTFY